MLCVRLGIMLLCYRPSTSKTPHKHPNQTELSNFTYNASIMKGMSNKSKGTEESESFLHLHIVLDTKLSALPKTKSVLRQNRGTRVSSTL